MITCQARNYKIENKEDKIVIQNELYDNSYPYIFLLALLEFAIPDLDDMKLPVAVIIENDEEAVIINKKLQVRGTDRYKYVVLKEHLRKWKYTFALVWILMITLELCISIAFGYTMFKTSNIKLYGVILLVIILFMGFVCGIKFIKQLRKLKKYPIIDSVNIKNFKDN